MNAQRFIEYLEVLPHSRSGSLINFSARVVFFPFFLAAELAALPFRITLNETVDYQLRKGRKGQIRGPRDVRIFPTRLKYCWHSSVALFVQAASYFLLLDCIALLGLQHLARNFRADIEDFCASLTGFYYEAVDGRKYASLLSTGDVHFRLCGGRHSLGQHSKLCPEVESTSTKRVDCPCRAAFFATCCSLSYAAEAVIEDVLRHRWRLRFVEYGSHAANLHLGEDYVADLIWFAASSPSAMVIAFTGAQPFHKIDRGTDIPCAMTQYPGCGRMSDGFVRGLDKPRRTGQSAYEGLEALVTAAAGRGAEVFLTGHSLGGATAVIFAQLLAARKPSLAAAVAGIFTYGAPRIGDQACVATVEQTFGGRLFRYVHASDMICKLPHAFEGVTFEHHHGERFLASFRPSGRTHRMLREEQDRVLTAFLEQREERLAHLYNLVKLLQPSTRSRGCGLFVRVLLLLLPGIADHTPAEYQAALNEVLLVEAGSHDMKNAAAAILVETDSMQKQQ